MKKDAVLGIDIGGTKTLCLLVDEKFKVLERIKFKTAPHEGRKKFTSELVGAARKLKQFARKEGYDTAGVGIGCAGLMDEQNLRIISSPNILTLEDYPVGKILKKALGVEIALANDVQMGIYGEHRLGAARDCANVLGVFFGTGVGGAAVINGRLYRGASGVGGQVGAILAQPVGGPKAAHSHGYLDRIASKAAIAGEALIMAVKEWAPFLHREAGSDLSKVTWGLIRQAIEEGDKVIDEMLRARMQVVGIALSNVLNFLNPEMLVLGGGLVECMPKLVLEEVETALREYLVPEVEKVLKVKTAELKGEAVALGAAHLAFEQAKAARA